MPNEFSRMLSQCSNFDSFYIDIRTHAEHTRKRFHGMLSIRGTNMTLKLPRKADGIQGTETSDWGKRTGDKEQRCKIRNRGREKRNKEVRHWTEDGIQVTVTWDRDQRAGNKEQRSETGNRGREIRTREVRYLTNFIAHWAYSETIS